MSGSSQLVVFRVDEQRYGLALAVVERIVRAVEVTSLPEAPAIVLGVIDVEGQVLPVLDLRRRLALPAREIDPASQFLIARTPRRKVVLVIDEALDVFALPTTGMVGAAQIVPRLKHVKGVVALADGLVLIQDLDQFLSLDEERALDHALKKEPAHA